MSAATPLFEVSQQDDLLLVVPQQDLGSLAAQDLEVETRRVDQALERAPAARHVVIDFSRVTYFGSIVVSLLVRLRKDCQARAGKLAVCNVPDYGLNLFKLFRLDSHWAICPDRAAAIAAVRA